MPGACDFNVVKIFSNNSNELDNLKLVDEDHIHE